MTDYLNDVKKMSDIWLTKLSTSLEEQNGKGKLSRNWLQKLELEETFERKADNLYQFSTKTDERHDN